MAEVVKKMVPLCNSSKTRRGWRFRAGMVLLVGTLSGQGALADTLADALVGAYTHTGLLDQNRALLRVADEDVAIAGAALKPIVNWTADLTTDISTSRTGFRFNSVSTSASAGLNATLQLFDGGADAARIEASKETVLATRAALISVEQIVLLRAATAYFNVQRQQEFVGLRQNNLRLLQQELRAAQDRFEVGEVTRTDVALAEAAVADARSSLADAQRDLVQAQAEYTNAVGAPPGRLSGLPRLPNTTTDIKSAQAVAVRNHPDMEQARHEVAANELLVTAAVADTSPTVTLDGSLGLTEDFDSSFDGTLGRIGINAGGPIYQGGALSANERRAAAVRDASRGNLHTVRHDVAQDVVDAISNFVAASASLVSSENQVRAARVAFQGVREEATLGARTTLDVLDSEQDLLDAETNRISAQADQYIAAYQVLESTGMLTAQRLKLPVQLYDPAAYYNLVKDGPAKRSKQGRQLDKVLRALQLD